MVSFAVCWAMRRVQESSGALGALAVDLESELGLGGVGMRAFGFSLRVGAGRGSRERRSGQEQGSRISEVCDDIQENETLK